MDNATLERMANRIGEFFAALPDTDEAQEGIVNHIEKFWEPRMRGQLLIALDAGNLAGLSDIVRKAVTQERARLQPSAAT